MTNSASACAGPVREQSGHRIECLRRSRDTVFILTEIQAALIEVALILPLFASEEEVSMSLMGPSKYVRWCQVAPLLEGRGFPKIDALLEGRYTPAIKDYFHRLYRVGG